MTAFAELAGTIYRVLRAEDEGVWLISYESPAAPFYMAGENLWKLKRIPAPEEYMEKTEQKLSKAQKRRLELIQPLLNNPGCISDKGLRSAMAEGIAAEQGTTPDVSCGSIIGISLQGSSQQKRNGRRRRTMTTTGPSGCFTSRPKSFLCEPPMT